ncbi:membrane protein [Thermopolyspora flexuosa]|uniref:Putative flippase GtrA n=1 Tax=Thermopolyspora flexuosa TaxID=103836 RepID=A0A543J274_9ACTN|nr:GtrA family protein [Thermopolyspora flexuosa]TQM76892.1 putative flippase GtrA [Thermopolyspora flexuosa]GGM87517.1 membrane protein [Thermopolyspora flexuosa]
MQLVRRLYERFSELVHEMAKFGTVGAAMFVLDWGCTNFLRYGLHLGPLTSKVIATVIAATCSYLLNRYWTWRHREKSGLAREYFLFFLLNGIGLLIALLVIGFVEYTLKLQTALAYNISIVLGNGLGTLFRFWSYKKWVFLPADMPPVDPHTGLPEAENSGHDESAAPAHLPAAEVRAAGRQPEAS